MSCLWYSSTGGSRASAASSTSHKTSIQLIVGRLASVITFRSRYLDDCFSANVAAVQKTTPGEFVFLPALPLLIVRSAGACHANPITPQESRQRQCPFFEGAGFGSAGRGA